MVQLGQAYDVVYEGEKTIGIMADLLCYVRYLFAAHHAGLNKLRIAGDGSQGSFELMRNIGGEILAHGSRLQDVFVLGADLVGERLKLPVDRRESAPE